MKKMLIAFLFLLSGFSLSFTAFAQENTEMDYYEEFDNYEEFEQDYLESVLDEIPREQRFKINAPAMAAGAVIAAGVTFIILRKSLNPPMAEPYFRQPEKTQKTVKKADNKIER